MSQTQPELKPPTMPRWVKILGVIVIIGIVMIGVVLLSGVQHGPNLHNPAIQVTHQP